MESVFLTSKATETLPINIKSIGAGCNHAVVKGTPDVQTHSTQLESAEHSNSDEMHDVGDSFSRIKNKLLIQDLKLLSLSSVKQYLLLFGQQKCACYNVAGEYGMALHVE